MSAHDLYDRRLKQIRELRELNAELLQELKNIANARWDNFNAEDFVGWAKNRARHTIAKTEALK